MTAPLLDPPARRLGPPPDAPISLDEAAEILRRHRRAHPALWRPPRDRNFATGVGVYRPEALPWVLCNVFARQQEKTGRLPDLIAPARLSDHYTAFKFFAPVRLAPVNPADKLDAWRLLPRALRRRVYIPRRVWRSLRPRLPADDAVPPGRYLLKSAMGHNMAEPVVWPPAPEERRRLTRRARRWLSRGFGVDRAEWWYAFAPGRVFLEEDLSCDLPDRLEVKVFVRDGRAQVYYAVRRHQGGAHEVSFYDRGHRYLEGRSVGRVRLVETPPREHLDLCILAAEAIGRRVPLCRVDFMIGRRLGPILGEITLCHLDGSITLTEPALDRLMSERLFGPRPRGFRRLRRGFALRSGA